MELSGIRQRQLLPVSRDDIDISKWKSGDEPIIMTSVVDGKVVEHKPYDFTNIFQSIPAPVDESKEQIEQDPEDAPKYSRNWTAALEVNLNGLAHYIKSCGLVGGNVLEIGCYEGRGTRLIDIFFKPSMFVCCDPWDKEYEVIGHHFKDQDKRYEFFKHNTKHLEIVEQRMTSDDFFKANETVFDFIYIDGDHSYAQAEKDLKNSLSALKVGGLCLVDDYVWCDFINPSNPVRRAVNDFAAANAKKIIRVNIDDDTQYAFMRTE